jgi:hypothetical protein
MVVRHMVPKARRLAVLATAAAALASTVFMLPLAGTASAAPMVTIPSGNPVDGQTFSVTGTGFPTRSQAPSGLSIIECSDPGGTTANLPIDSSGCDATTQSGAFFTDANGNFSTTYSAQRLTNPPNAIQCDQSNFCVLWAGVDFNTQFSQGAFSRPFEIGAPPAMTPETAVAIALPITAALIAGGTYVYIRRRRSQSPVAA